MDNREIKILKGRSKRSEDSATAKRGEEVKGGRVEGLKV
jgi:hypothetical protein